MHVNVRWSYYERKKQILGYSAADIVNLFKDCALAPLRRVMQGDANINEVSPSRVSKVAVKERMFIALCGFHASMNYPLMKLMKLMKLFER